MKLVIATLVVKQTTSDKTATAIVNVLEKAGYPISFCDGEFLIHDKIR